MKKFNTYRIRGIFLIVFAVLSQSLEASLLSYRGGWRFATDNQEDSLSWQLSYSFRSWFALGVDYDYDKMGDPNLAKHYILGRTTFLLKRWNNEDSQANIYIYGGGGALRAGNQSSPAWFSGAEADWESRRVYTSAMAQYLDSSDYRPDVMYQARIGAAPYLTKFDNLHSWVILQAQYFPEANGEKWRIAPLMRFYIENVLWEMGVSSQGAWIFNTMVHF